MNDKPEKIIYFSTPQAKPDSSWIEDKYSNSYQSYGEDFHIQPRQPAPEQAEP